MRSPMFLLLAGPLLVGCQDSVAPTLDARDQRAILALLADPVLASALDGLADAGGAGRQGAALEELKRLAAAPGQPSDTDPLARGVIALGLGLTDQILEETGEGEP